MDAGYIETCGGDAKGRPDAAGQLTSKHETSTVEKAKLDAVVKALFAELAVDIDRHHVLIDRMALETPTNIIGAKKKNRQSLFLRAFVVLQVCCKIVYLRTKTFCRSFYGGP